MAVGGISRSRLAREIAPLLTATFSRQGGHPAYAAQLGTYEVTEQIDAIRCLRHRSGCPICGAAGWLAPGDSWRRCNACSFFAVGVDRSGQLEQAPFLFSIPPNVFWNWVRNLGCSPVTLALDAVQSGGVRPADRVDWPVGLGPPPPRAGPKEVAPAPPARRWMILVTSA